MATSKPCAWCGKTFREPHRGAWDQRRARLLVEGLLLDHEAGHAERSGTLKPAQRVIGP